MRNEDTEVLTAAQRNSLLGVGCCTGAFDPHALAMALQLADLVEWIPITPGWVSQSKVARWLRREVQRELGSQP